MASKFPASEGGGNGIRVGFGWTDTLRAHVGAVTQHSWLYEMACVAFNIAALESILMTSIDRTKPEGIDAAKNGLISAAGMLCYVRDNLAGHLLGTIPLDLRPDGLTLYINLLLGDAQVCYYEAAKAKNMNSAALSKLAGSAADFFRAASTCLTGAERADADRVFPWHAHCESWAALFDAAAFYRYADVVLEASQKDGQGYGARVGWLIAAEAACNAAISIPEKAAQEAHKGSRGPVPPSKVNTSSARALIGELHTLRAEAAKDNDRIYFQSVPKLADLPVLPRAALAKPGALPDLSPAGVGMRDLFEDIIPAEIAASLATIPDRVSAIAGSARARSTSATDDARSTLASLGLPGYLEASSQERAGLPPAVWDRVARVQMDGGLPELERLWGAISRAAAAAGDVLRQADGVISEEVETDAHHRAQYGGKRWTATPSDIVVADFRAELTKYSALMSAASGSDGHIRAKLEAYRPVLDNLSRSRAELDATVPAGPASGTGGAGGSGAFDEAEALRGSLRSAVAALDALLEKRAKLAADVKEGFDRRSAVAVLTGVPKADHAAKLDALLAQPNPVIVALDANIEEQAKLLDHILTAHSRYQQVRALDERTKARERAVQSVCEAVDKYEELKGNLREGEAFWGELRGRADLLLQQCRDMLAARNMQRKELMMSMAAAEAAASSMAASSSPSSQTPYFPGPPGQAGAPQQAQGGYPSWATFGPPTTGPTTGAGAGSHGGSAVPVALPSLAPSVPPYDPFGPSASSASSPSWGQAPSAPFAAPLPPQQQGMWPGAGGSSAGYPASSSAPMGIFRTSSGGSLGAPGPASAPTTPIARTPSGSAAETASGQQLQSMGFSREAVERALKMHGGDFDSALNQLITDTDGRSGV